MHELLIFKWYFVCFIWLNLNRDELLQEIEQWAKDKPIASSPIVQPIRINSVIQDVLIDAHTNQIIRKN